MTINAKEKIINKIDELLSDGDKLPQLLSDKLESALRETIEIEKEYKEGTRKGYYNANEMLRSIMDDEI